MMKYITSFLLISSSSIGFSGDVPAIDSGFGTAEIKAPDLPLTQKHLNSKEVKASELAKKWMERRVMPVMDADGKIVYVYGATLPTVICAPLQLCDIELQAGEKLRGTDVGDKVRWLISPAISGNGRDEVVHVNVKPTETGITSTLVINTDRRTYHIKLLSRNKDYMPRVGFVYQSDVEKEWAEFYATQAATKERNTIPETKQNLDDLYFDYEISGTAPWKPLRVYNDSRKTYIQMPKEMAQTEAPALLLIGTDGKNQLVNYRLRKDRFVVDSIFAEAVLITGVGSSQTKITIVRKNSDVYKKREKEARDEI
jgi:type IV secretion system protein VirB9